jgi:hypothetical protein
MRLHLRSFPVFLVLALSTPADAAGKGDKTTKAQENEARAACLMGNYQKGTEILVRLFIQTHDPVYLYNQGRCYQQNHRWEEAIDRFREYLRKNPKLDDKVREDVRTQIAECEASLPKTPVIQPPPPATTPIPLESSQGKTGTESPGVLAAARPVSDQASEGADRVELVAPTPGQASSGTSVFSRWWFWTAVGVVVAGGVMAGLLLSRGSSSRTPFTCPECESTLGVNAP